MIGPGWRHIALLLTACLAWSATALAQPAEIVVDAETGAVLHAENASRRWYPASLAKMMTLYLVFEALEAGRLASSQPLPVSDMAAAQPPTELGLRGGDRIAVEAAILAVIARSANDAAVVLAEHLAGSESAFAAAMTRKAAALGMTRTVFRNATGLPDNEQTTTARDMAVLARALLRDFPQHYHYFSVRSFAFGGQMLSTVNGLLASYVGADGIKTGFTCGSGYNLVASATRDGRRLIGVILGAGSTAARNAAMARLLDDAFAGRGAAPAHLSLAGLADAGEDAPPVAQLSPDQCAVAGGPIAAAVRLSGWGLAFGAFSRESQARAAIDRARSVLHPVLSGGRPVVARRQGGDGQRYSALLVGLQRREAGTACQRLRDEGFYCLVLNPEALNNPKAAWR